MGDLIIKPASSGSLKIQDQAGTDIITTSGTSAGVITFNGFTGMVAAFAMSSAPTGWLTCDGTAVSRTTYSDLFTAIGTTWGAGDGTTTFNLPDLRGAFLRGTGSHGTSNMANGNDFAGPSVGSFENDQIQNMKSYTDGSGNGGALNGSSSDYSAYNLPWNSSLGANWAADGFIENGQGTPRLGDETRPFNAGINYCIKI